MFFRYASTLALLLSSLLLYCSAALSQQTESNNLELKLEQFQEQPSNAANSELQLDLKQFDQQKSGEELELNLNQFDQKKPADGNVEGEDPGVGKINTTGSAATRIDDSDSAELSDDAYLLRTGLWFLAIAIPIFLFMRARIRRRRRERPPGHTSRRTTYDESDHR